MDDGPMRERLTEGMYFPKEADWSTEQIARLDRAFHMTLKADKAEAKIRRAIKDGVLPKKKIHLLLEEARAKNVITADEFRLVQEADQVRFDAILVDDFDEKEYHAEV